jgi:hypothetical protein
MQTWTLARFLHILAMVFFVDERTMRIIARRFGIGSVAAIARGWDACTAATPTVCPRAPIGLRTSVEEEMIAAAQ